MRVKRRDATCIKYNNNVNENILYPFLVIDKRQITVREKI